jgi:hypothetical protein
MVAFGWWVVEEESGLWTVPSIGLVVLVEFDF